MRRPWIGLVNACGPVGLVSGELSNGDWADNGSVPIMHLEITDTASLPCR